MFFPAPRIELSYLHTHISKKFVAALKGVDGDLLDYIGIVVCSEFMSLCTCIAPKSFWQPYKLSASGFLPYISRKVLLVSKLDT